MSVAEPGEDSREGWVMWEHRAWRVSRWALGAVVAGVAFIAVAQRTPARSSLAELRDSFLVRHVAEAGLVYAPPPSLRAAGFREDESGVRERWMSRVARLPGWETTLGEVRRVDGSVERGRALARALTSQDAGAPSACGDVGDLELLLRFIGSGGVACCSDYTAAFLSLAPSLGITAREVRVAVPHGVVEVYDERRVRWVMIDPLFGMMARDGEGRPLSVWALQRALSANEDVRFEFFGRELDAARPDRGRAVFDSIYGPRFVDAELSTPMGNNVLTYDEFRRPLAFLPKSLVQAAALVRGIFPEIVALRPDGARTAHMRTALVRSAVLVTSIGLFVGLLCGPIVALVRRALALQARRSIDGAPVVGRA